MITQIIGTIEKVETPTAALDAVSESWIDGPFVLVGLLTGARTGGAF